MPFILDDMDGPEPISAAVEDGRLRVDLIDGRTIIVPISFYPRLVHATPEERNQIELDPIGLHFPVINECISVAGLLAGGPSDESEASFKEWLRKREAGESVQGLILPPSAYGEDLPDESDPIVESEEVLT